MSQISVQVITQLRRWISEERYAPGERVAEVQVAEALGVSRMPVRLAFRTLEQEGLLQRSGKRGFFVREFSRADVLCGLEVRGVLEGLAARRLAEAGVAKEVLAVLRQCLVDGEKIFAHGELREDDVAEWSRINSLFHTTIVQAAGSNVIADAIARNDHLPFASSDSIIIDNAALDKEFKKLQLAQWQHQMVVQALERGEGARAEMLMREHAYVGIRYGALFGLEEGS